MTVKSDGNGGVVNSSTRTAANCRLLRLPPSSAGLFAVSGTPGDRVRTLAAGTNATSPLPRSTTAVSHDQHDERADFGGKPRHQLDRRVRTIAIESIDNALNTVNNIQATLGAAQNRFTAIATTQQAQSTDLSQAQSQITGR